MNSISSEEVGIQDSSLPRANFTALAPHLVYQVALFGWKITPPCILLLGSFGNVATIFVMHRIKDDNSSQRAILMALAVSDLTLLCTDLTPMWVKQVFHVDLWVLHIVLCKFSIYITAIGGATSAWLVTCVTVQRTMAVLWPHRMRVMCTVRRTWIVIATLTLAACAFYFPLMLVWDIVEENACYMGMVTGMDPHFLQFVYPWVHFCLASFIPTVLLFVCDIILSITLFKAVFSSALGARADSNVQISDSRRKTSYRTTVMILTISCAFLLFTMPECFYIIWVPYVSEEIRQDSEALATAYFIHSVTYNMWYTNSAINFFLYCLTGTKFRREFVSWICSCAAHSPSSAPSVHQTSEVSKGGGQKYGHSPLSK